MHRWKNLSSSTEAWEAIEALELVNIEVVSLTSDGTKQNRQFYSLCQIADDQSHNQLPYKTPSLYREHCNPCHRGGSNETPLLSKSPSMQWPWGAALSCVPRPQDNEHRAESVWKFSKCITKPSEGSQEGKNNYYTKYKYKHILNECIVYVM